MFIASMLVYVNIALFLSVSFLGIYALVLLIKALKIYIRKNS